MFRRELSLAWSLLALWVLPEGVVAQTGNWEHLRPTPAERLRSTTFELKTPGNIAAIRLGAEGGHIFVGRADVFYDDSRVLEIQINEVVRANVDPRPIPIDRGRVNRIVITNGAAAGADQPPRLLLEVERERGPAGFSPEWRVLGELTLSSRWTDANMGVGRGVGPFEAIRIGAPRGPINFRNVEIVFGNGSRQFVRVRPLLRSQSSTNRIELDGGARFIREVLVQARAVGGLGARSQLLIEGAPVPSQAGLNDSLFGPIDPRRPRARNRQNLEICIRHRARAPRSGSHVQGWVCTTQRTASDWLNLGDDTGWRNQQIQIRSSGAEFCFAHERRGTSGNWSRTGWVCSSNGQESAWATIGDDTGYRQQRVRFRLKNRSQICGRFTDRGPRNKRDSGWQCSARGDATPWINLGDDTGYRDQKISLQLQ